MNNRPNISVAEPGEPAAQLLVIDRSEFCAELATGLAAALADLNKDEESTAAAKRRSRKPGPARVARRLTRAPALDETRLEELVGTALLTAFSNQSRAVIADAAALELFDSINELLPDARNKRSVMNIEKLVEVLVETNDPLARVTKQIDTANAKARVRFIEQVRTLTSEEVADAADHSATNRSQSASRWKRAGRIFSVRWQGQERFPAFQFEDGKPLPVIKEVLHVLPTKLSAWEVAFWFVSSNPWLDGRAPIDMLYDSDALIKSAREQVQAVVG